MGKSQKIVTSVSLADALDGLLTLHTSCHDGEAKGQGQRVASSQQPERTQSNNLQGTESCQLPLSELGSGSFPRGAFT